MNASNDSSHAGQNDERRQRFRIEDTAILEVSEASIEDMQHKVAESFFTSSNAFNLIRDLRAIDSDNSSILRMIGEHHSDIAVYLAALNSKIDAIARAVAENILPEGQRLQAIDLSEGGIGFKHENKMEEQSFYAMKIWFHQALIGISVFIRVVACNRAIDGGYHISAAFHQMPESESQTIARHIMAVQAATQRSKRADPSGMA